MKDGNLLGQILIDKGYISAAELEVGIHHQQSSRKRLADVLLEMHLITHDQLNDALAQCYSIPVVELTPEMLSDELWQTIPDSFISEYQVIPILVDGRTLHVVTGDPSQIHFKEKLERITGRQIEVSLADDQVVRTLIAQRMRDRMVNPISRDSSISIEIHRLIESGVFEIQELENPDNAVVISRSDGRWLLTDIDPALLRQWCQQVFNISDDFDGIAYVAIQRKDRIMPACLDAAIMSNCRRYSVRFGREMRGKQPVTLPEISKLRDSVNQGQWIFMTCADPWIFQGSLDLLPVTDEDRLGWMALTMHGTPVPDSIPQIIVSGHDVEHWRIALHRLATMKPMAAIIQSPFLIQDVELDVLQMLRQNGSKCIWIVNTPGPYAIHPACAEFDRSLLISVSRLRRLCNACRRPASTDEYLALPPDSENRLHTAPGCKVCSSGILGTYTFIETLHSQAGRWMTLDGTSYPSDGGRFVDFPSFSTPANCMEHLEFIHPYDIRDIFWGWRIRSEQKE